jgi:hypothetical protein
VTKFNLHLQHTISCWTEHIFEYEESVSFDTLCHRWGIGSRFKGSTEVHHAHPVNMPVKHKLILYLTDETSLFYGEEK